MGFERFIASRFRFSSGEGFTNVIVRIAAISIAVSIAIMIITSTLIYGFKDKIINKVYGFWGHIQITDSNISRSYEVKPLNENDINIDEILSLKQLKYQSPKSILGFEIKDSYVDKETKGGVKVAQPFITIPGLIQTKDYYLAIMQKGVDQTYDWSYIGSYIKEGRIPHITEDSISNETIISKDIAAKLILGVGDEYIMSYIKDNQPLKKKMKVVGIYSTGLAEYDKKFIFCDIKELQETLGWTKDEVVGYEVFVDNIDDIPAFNEYLYYNILPSNVYSESTRNKYPGIFDWLELQSINERIILQLMVVVGIINMITVLLILILERSRMIGILKALGARNSSIRKIFLFKAAYIIFYGLLWGNIIGIGLCFLQEKFEFITLDESSYYLDVAPIKFDWMKILMIDSISFLIVMFCLVLPSMLISRLKPVSVLRYE